MRRRWEIAVAVALAASFCFGVTPAEPVAGAPTPLLTEPPTGLRGYPLFDSYYDLVPFGYEEAEYLVSGTAADGDGVAAPYTTRIIVTRPNDPSRFNGTVFLDWVNVTAQFENAVDTMLAREQLMREGFAYVHVSVQAAGLCCTPLTPRVWDPLRYAAVNHPGDAWSFDILTQVAQAFRTPQSDGGLDPMGTLGTDSVRHVLAAGQSQSANRLAEYVQSWLPAHPAAVGIIDGILVHGNVPGDKSFAVGSPVPVLHLLSDFEAVGDGIDPAAVDPNYRLWEIAGAAHADYFIGVQSIYGHGPRVMVGAAKLSEPAFRDLIDQAGNYGEVIDPLLAVCTAAGATMPMHYATSAAIHQLRAWVEGTADPHNGPRFQFAGGRLATDGDGNTVGGIRLPPIDVPVAQYLSTVCGLGGITVPFTDLEIQARYGTHATYHARMADRTDAAVAAGWLLPDDAADLMRRVCRASIRFGTPGAPCPAYAPPPYDTPLAVAASPVSATPSGVPAAAAAPAPKRPAGALPATGTSGPSWSAALVLFALAARLARSTLQRSADRSVPCSRMSRAPLASDAR